MLREKIQGADSVEHCTVNPYTGEVTRKPARLVDAMEAFDSDPDAAAESLTTGKIQIAGFGGGWYEVEVAMEKLDGEAQVRRVASKLEPAPKSSDAITPRCHPGTTVPIWEPEPDVGLDYMGENR